MAAKSKTKVFIVDDDSCILDAVCLHLEKAGHQCQCFSNAKQCLKQISPKTCKLLITDVKMPDKDGIQLMIEVKKNIPWLPVLLMTSFGDVPMAVKAVKAGAVDFIEKPFDWDDFIKLVQSAIDQTEFSNSHDSILTKTEMTVLRLILNSQTSKQIANSLHRSVRTVEVHRSHIMHKLKVDNIVDLVKKVATLGLDKTA
ncbi:MAG: response regulator transcription factor [Planctomycetes bacterium]|nr:response regulator transcription factor [Planctomycetota bacterium]